MTTEVIHVDESKEDEFLTVKQTPKQFRVFSESAIRGLISNNTRGFNDQVVHRVGRKVLISTKCFREWLRGCK